MIVRVYFTEVNYGYVEVEVDETNPKHIYEQEIYDKAWDAIAEGDDVVWTKTDSDITDWEEA